MMGGLLPIEWMANIAMHLSRHLKGSFFVDQTLRPGDGKRYAALTPSIFIKSLR
jgi:hypothetical protein